MPVCKKCGSFVDDEVEFCPFCKTTFEHSSTNKLNIDIDDNNQKANGIIVQNPQKTQNEEDFDEESFIIKTPDLDELVEQEQKEQGLSSQLEIIPERKYILWFLLGIVTIGICFLVYLFINLEDLEKHSQYPNDPRAEPIRVSAMQSLTFFLVALCFGFIPILWWIYYKKYASLYDHLKKQKNDMAPIKIPHTALYLVPLVISHLTALIPTIIGWILTAKNEEVVSIRLSIPWLFWTIWAIVLILTLFTSVLDYFWQRAFNAHNRMTMAKININEGIIEEEAQKITLLVQESPEN
ncbi:MAG: hypothetical protein JXA54_16390 [Candidatus Heimdallarchaeota archaeon]|nr:hypothetical protein [Candidatus Heimdallarchaeota archaeon]